MFSGVNLGILIAVFLASLVESVEALTIIIAAGTARNWKSSRRGAYAGLIVLALLILIFGPLLIKIPINSLRLVVGAILLIFGFSWLKKSILRSVGIKGLHDEAEIYERELQDAKAAKKENKFGVSDWYAFTLSFKAVLLEGLEVAFIVVTLGSAAKKLWEPALTAASAVILVIILGLIIAKPLTKVPENFLKYTVGICLVAFGIFWSVEGLGLKWPKADIAIIYLIETFVVISRLLVFYLKYRYKKLLLLAKQEVNVVKVDKSSEEAKEILESTGKNGFRYGLKKFGAFWYDFIIGDDPKVAISVLIGLLITSAVKSHGKSAIYILPTIVMVVMIWTLELAARSYAKSI